MTIILAALIKSPIEYLLGGIRFFNVTFPAAPHKVFMTMGIRNGITKLILDQGLDFYEPYDVAGYDAYFPGTGL